MYHPNYPPNAGPGAQPTGGYLPYPQHPPTGHSMNMPYSNAILPQGMPPPTSNVGNNMMPPPPPSNYPHLGKISPSIISDSMKQQQNQMYLRPPNLMQTGKPSGYPPPPGNYPPNMMPIQMMNPGPFPYHLHSSSEYPHSMPSAIPDYPGHIRPNNYYNYPPNGVYKYPERINPNPVNLPNENTNVQQNTSIQENKSSTSTTSEERSETPKANYKTISHPSTPNPLGSPGAASMSSFHDEFDNVSSPSLPRTPASPAVNLGESNHSKSNSKKGEVFSKLYEMGDEPDRKLFLDKLVSYNEERGINHNQCPSINKQLIDLFKLYSFVKEKGGFAEITKSKKWKDVASYVLNKDSSAPMAYTLRKQYIKHLLPYECKYDRDGIDSQQLLNQVDAPKEKKKSNKSAPSPCAIDSNSQGSYPQAATPLSSDGSNSNKPTNGQTSNVGRVTPTTTTTNSNESLKFNQNVSQSPSTSTSASISGSKNFDPKHQLQSPLNFQNSNFNSNLPTLSHIYYNNQNPNHFENQQVKNENSSELLNRNNMTPTNSPYNKSFYGSHPGNQGQSSVPNARNDEMANSQNNNEPSINSNNEPSYAPNHSQMNPSSQHPHYMGPDHYQNVSRTQSPLAQRLLQQKSPIPTGYGASNHPQSSIYNGPNMLGKNQPGHQENQQSNLNSPIPKEGYSNYGKRPIPTTPTRHPENQQPGQMVYHSPSIGHPPNQFTYHPPSYRPPNVPIYNFDGNNSNNSNWNDPNYGKIQNYNANPVSSTNNQPSYNLNNQLPSQQHTPMPSNKPQYLLNLLANNANNTPSMPLSHSSAMNIPNNSINSHQSLSITSQPRPGLSSSHTTSLPMNHIATSHHASSSITHPSTPNYYAAPSLTNNLQSHVSVMNNRDIYYFPSGSVEAVQPTYIKRKKMTPKDINQIETWRLMMSLRSGLLAESTWALDVLSILVHDDNTYMYFGLQKLPGLLDILIEYYKHYLTEIFSDLFDNDSIEENKNSKSSNKKIESETINRMKKKFISNGLLDEDNNDANEKTNENQDSFKLNKKFKDVNSDSVKKLFDKDSENEHKQLVLSSKNDYTFITRTGKPVKINPDENLFVTDFEKSWDVKENLISFENENKFYFSKGYGSITSYIQEHFEVKETSLKFARSLDKKYKEYEENASDKENDTSKQNQQIISDSKDFNERNDIYPKFRTDINKRKHTESFESEAYKRDQPPLCTSNDYNEIISRRCVCISTLIRNMSFVPGNETEFSKYKDLLFILGKLLLLHHQHFEKRTKPKSLNLKHLEETLFNEIENTKTTEQLNILTNKKSSSETLDYLLKDEWWWDTLHFIRENTLVTLANISGKLDLSKYPECVSLNIFDGLLHWAVCTSSEAQDHLPSTSLVHLSPKRLSLECLAKLSILESNVDLIISTPPWDRMLQLFKCLADQLSRDQEQTLREFALVLIHNLAISDTAIARSIAISSECIAQLINFIEFAEQNALSIVNTQGFHVLKENPECIGTTLDMIKRAATCLRCLARIQENRPLFFNYQQRLIALLMSQVLHPNITCLVADILYECSLNESFDSKDNEENSNITINSNN